MESATNYVQNFLSGYRVPDFSKLWRKSDSSVDGREKPHVPLLVRLEAHLVQLQEIALWIDPKSSVAALAIVHLIYWYLANTSCTILNLTTWACILGFLYTTWVNRIWPEIRVEKPAEESAWTPVRPEVFSAPELVQFSQMARTKFASGLSFLRDMRANSPGRFCLVACFTFSVVGYLGAYVTALGLFYYTVVCSLTVPGLVRVLAQNHPGIQNQIEAYWNVRSVSEPASDVTDSPVEPAPPTPAFTNVYSKVQAQIASMVSGLNASPEGELVTQDDEEDDLKEYLPEVEDEQTKKILEEGALSQEQLHNQDEDTSLEYSSLMTGLGTSMPDIEEDEVESGPRLLPALSMATATPSTSVAQRSFQPVPIEEDEFLPTVDPSCNQLLLDELDEEEENSSLYFSNAAGSHPVESSPISGFDEPDEKEDFEFISEDELAEASAQK